MDDMQEIKERLVRIEANSEYTAKEIEVVKKTATVNSDRIKTIEEKFAELRGIKWIVAALVAFIATLIGKIAGFIHIGLVK